MTKAAFNASDTLQRVTGCTSSEVDMFTRDDKPLSITRLAVGQCHVD